MLGGRNPDDSIPVGWTALENRLYRRDSIYDNLHWPVQPIELSKAIVAVSTCGGPIALVPNEGWVGLSCALEIYSLSGHLLTRFDRLLEKTVPPSQVIALGWSANDLLTIVYNDGAVVRIPGGIHKNRIRITRVLAYGKEERIYDATVLQCGHVVLRGVSGDLYHLSPKDKVQQENITIKPPEAVERLFPRGSIASLQLTNSPQSTAGTIFITESGNVSCCNSNGTFELPGEREVSQICVSPNGQYLAAMESTTGSLFVTTADLGSEIARVDLAAELTSLAVENVYSEVIFDAKKPVSVAWVGSDAIAVLYTEQIILVGPHGGVAVLTLGEKFSNGGIILHSETDGLRLLSSRGHDFIQMVAEPVHTARCRRQSSSYKLLKSCGSLEGITTTTSPEALNRYRLLRELRESGSLQEASRNCTAAAYLEVSTLERKRFLQAAAYGQRHASVFANEQENLVPPRNSSQAALYTKMAEERSRRERSMVPTAVAILRVLHAAGTSECGFPMTKPQFDVLGLPALVARLSRFGRHTLAVRLATFGRISPYDVLAEWAIAALHANVNESDESITNLIAERFDTVLRSYNAIHLHGSQRGRAMPYVVAAETAYALGKQKCAELLLRRETRPAPKVAMYLRMGREAPAIVASVSSGDPELVLDALGSVLERKNGSVHEFAKLLRSLPPALGNRATDLFASYLKQIGDYKSLRKVYLEVGRRREAAMVEIYLADKIADPADRMAALEGTVQSISRGYSRRSCYFEVQAVQHAAVAAASAIDLEKKGRLEPGTLRHANDGDLLARAVVDIPDANRRRDTLAKLRKDLKIPDRRFFWICLDSMAEVGDFESIEALSNSSGYGRAPPIGLTAFVDTCIKYKMDDEAVKYAFRISDLRDRARALARCGRGREAADIASRLRNNQLLEEVQDLAARHVEYITIPLGRLKE